MLFALTAPSASERLGWLALQRQNSMSGLEFASAVFGLGRKVGRGKRASYKSTSVRKRQATVHKSTVYKVTADR